MRTHSPSWGHPELAASGPKFLLGFAPGRCQDMQAGGNAPDTPVGAPGVRGFQRGSVYKRSTQGTVLPRALPQPQVAHG